ncbi:tripartite motif-containing protein 2-like isoform X3 [Sitophilus oryzae]|uniref:Tripartite motif-containing protein 2-like isoform X3 n=2 Tax=Sitophilus oryzae TaxID=7048 RepID=A0A6J2XV95_SITOR|nr:tripartite motif-containing protein 2-like isoform X3 [Sitophilus oryzae]
MDGLRFAIQSRLGERMISMNSTLVEMVNINYEDFNESFLTCGTCLCMYDGSEHTPKLLQCSHTVCLHCLTRIAASQTRDTGSFRCPICRELITIPRGGVSALPPSFLVNQLLDLMSRQRREVIPKCSVHINEELLFCETCDTVFCTQCTGGSHNDSTNSCEHTIIPFSIAIKRMSEILLYKANECISKLSQAQEGVASELNKLNIAKDKCIEQIEATFQQIQVAIDRRKQEMVDQVNQMCNEKKRVLDEQHGLIENEKNKVEQECQGLQYQVEVRNITQKIEILTEKLDTAFSLGEPRENCFLTCDFSLNDSLDQIQQHLGILGKVRTSTTFPSLCTAQIDDNIIAGIESCVTLTTVDYHGNARKTGGDPIQAEVSLVTADQNMDSVCPLRIHDCDDGTYKIFFRARKAGRYGVKISVIDRPIKDNPMYFDVSEHNNPIAIYGTRGSGKDEFNQPVAVAIDERDQTIYVLDTGNSRIKVLNEQFEFLKHVTNEGLLGRSCTGIAISNNGLVVVNWRSKVITEMDTDGGTIKSFTYNAFQEPIDVAVDRSYGHLLVADNGMSCVFVFDDEGKILFQVGKKGTFSLISSVAVGSTGEIFVADSRLQMFSAKGDFLEIIYDEGKGKGRYGGIIVDQDNRIIASRTEQKGRTYLQVLSSNDKNVNQYVDSHDSKLKRPSGCAVTNDFHVVVVDLGNNCIKKYRYW